MIIRFYFAVTLLTQLLTMSAAANDNVTDPWQIEFIEESQHQISQAEEAINDESNASVRRSSRLASKSSCSPPSIIDWPLPKLLETLYRHDIPAPTGASHKELFALLCEKIDVPAADIPPPPPFSGKKQTQKRKNLEPASTSADVAPKRAGGSDVSTRAIYSSSVQNKDPVLSALSSIQSSLSNMNSRIQALESGSRSKASANFSISGPSCDNSSSTTARLPVFTPQQNDDVINSVTIPRRTMGSAVPVTTGSPFFPPAAAISHQLRSQIIAGVVHKLVWRTHYLQQRRESPCPEPGLHPVSACFVNSAGYPQSVIRPIRCA
ncbi:uncharacterized protein [Paramisgurnus dabryanus]|uniref:uncharacterized protein n=1 Tax=Paramisgurnus dabryanus TaxID=90735 RepID=UPI003CCF37B8